MFKKEVPPDTTAINLVSEPVDNNNDHREVYSVVNKRKEILKRLMRHQNSISSRLLYLDDREIVIRERIKETRNFNDEKSEKHYLKAFDDLNRERAKLEKDLYKCVKREHRIRHIINNDKYDKDTYKSGKRSRRLLLKARKAMEIAQSMRDNMRADSFNHRL